ncbi:ATP-grasp domain-containing protein [Tumebacillus sp. BK434]|uniref:ATP-grasp domain-containing protein n=1 Tax=Tumebacillus sp. BK434 TaxID=2512169 RepID=UPI00104C0592|nr:ATP-grasp domain-containing protein [Tumebacillus sp. BK434]TCP55889.1 ATP-grasp domain-containing protein [Tumebacillus sp. BK434]
MSRPKAVVFIDNNMPLTLTLRAAYAQDQGYLTFLVSPEFEEHVLALIDNFVVNKREGIPLYTRRYATQDFDRTTLQNILAEIEQEADIAGMITGNGPFCKDGLVCAHVAALAAERGLPSQGEAALYLANNKYLMRDKFRATGVNTIDFGLALDEASAAAEANRIGYPVLMKPINGVASHLIMKCNSAEEVVANFRHAMEKLPGSTFQSFYEGAHSFPNAQGELVHFDPMRCLLLEQYIPGREVAVEVLITEDRYIPLVVQDKAVLTEDGRSVYEDLLITPPVRFTEEECRELEACAVAAAQAIGLKNSIAHIELRYGENGLGPQVLEINSRIGGGFTHEVLRSIVDVDYVSTYVELMTGTYQAKAHYERKNDPHGFFILFAPHAGFYESIEGLDELKAMPGVISTMQPFPVGSQISGDEEEVFLLMAWMKVDNYEHLLSTYQKAKEIIKFKITPNETSVQA